MANKLNNQQKENQMAHCKAHPTLDCLCFDTGEVLVLTSGKRKYQGHITSGSKHNRGYMTVTVDGKAYLVHRLVVEAFIGEIPAGEEVDHINRNKSDNRLVNLRVVSHSENCRNRAATDKVTSEGRTHKYEDYKLHKRDVARKYRAENPEKARVSCRESARKRRARLKAAKEGV